MRADRETGLRLLAMRPRRSPAPQRRRRQPGAQSRPRLPVLSSFRDHDGAGEAGVEEPRLKRWVSVVEANRVAPGGGTVEQRPVELHPANVSGGRAHGHTRGYASQLPAALDLLGVEAPGRRAHHRHS